MRIHTKLFVAYLLAAVLLLGSLTYLLTKRSGDVLLESVTETMTQNLAQIAVNFEHLLESYEETAHAFYLNIQLQETLNERYPDDRAAYERYFGYLQPYLTVVQGTKNYYRIRFYSDNPTLTFANVIQIDDDVRREEWYRSLTEGRRELHWTGMYDIAMSDARVFSLRQRMDYADPGAELYASFEIPERELHRLIEEEKEGRRIVMAMSGGEVLLDSAGREAQAARLSDYPFAASVTAGAGHYRYEEDGRSYLVLHSDLGRSAVRGMQIVMLVPLDELMLEVREMTEPAYWMLGLSALLAAGIIYGLSIGMTRRLTTLAKKMRSAHRDQYRGYVAIRGNDEISQLGRIFNEMVQRLETLIREVYEARIDRTELALRTREAEFYALQAQINPHYLFNVLNMLRSKLMEQRDDDSAQIVGLIAKSYRFLLQNKSETVTVGQELGLVETYLRIQQLRFEHRLRYEIDVPDEVMDMTIPKLALQPLVENAMTHGVEPEEGTTTVRISAAIGEGRYALIVEDDGRGIGAERLSEIRHWLEDSDEMLSERHIGIRNIHYRLTKLFGPEAGLTIANAAGRGVRAVITIPLSGQSEPEKPEEPVDESANDSREEDGI